MATQDTISVQNHTIEPKDFPKIAEQIIEEHIRRKDNRKVLVKRWDEVDRQLAMTPELSHKKNADNSVDNARAWMPETELPLQSQTLEMLVSDARRMLFPRGRDWFIARAAITNDYLDAFAKAESPIVRETGRFQGSINQDNADRLAQASLAHFHRQYDFRSHVDLINAESFSYGFGAGRVRKVRKSILGHTLKGKQREIKIPMLVPVSCRNLHLDDSAHAIMHEGYILGPNTLQDRKIKLADLMAAAKDDDSYIKSQISILEKDAAGEVMLVELEGDLVYETSSSTIIVRNVCLTAALGKGKNNYGLIRHQESEGSTYIIFNYHLESTVARYATSPLLKGAPVNRIAAQLMNRLIESGQLKIQPPISYSKDDPEFAATGGPVVQPGAQWESTDGVDVHADVGGDPSAFFNIFGGMASMYADVTGVNPPRLGAQTKSHTTAFAKDAELSQGAIRTVDYVDSILEGPLPRFLEMEYHMALRDWKKQVVYVDAWNEFVELERAHLPDIALFKALGASAPSEDLVQQQRQVTAVQTALQIDNIAVQLGRDPKIDHGKLIDKILLSGGFTDVSEITAEQEQEPIQGNGQLPGLLSAEVPQQ